MVWGAEFSVVWAAHSPVVSIQVDAWFWPFSCFCEFGILGKKTMALERFLQLVGALVLLPLIMAASQRGELSNEDQVGISVT